MCRRLTVVVSMARNEKTTNISSGSTSHQLKTITPTIIVCRSRHSSLHRYGNQGRALSLYRGSVFQLALIHWLESWKLHIQKKRWDARGCAKTNSCHW
jgi:hypothetical protein